MLRRLILAVVVVEVAYLALANLALNLQLTQSLVNQHRPDQYAVHWDRAWSWYPLRVHARGISADGQTSSQQWQADVGSASASLSLLPLLDRTVRLAGVHTEDISFRLRPRPKLDKDYAEVRDFFPPIEGRDPSSPATPRKAPKEGPGWKIQVEGVHATGSHQIWIRQVRADLDGELNGDVSYESRGGPVSVTGGRARIALRSLVLNRDWEVSSGGTLDGQFDLAPFSPSEHPGIAALGFLSLDAAVDTPVDSLEFLDFYLRRLGGMTVDGKGRVQGRLHYVKGDLAAGTHLDISAQELVLSADPYQARGSGHIGADVTPEQPDTLAIAIGFDDLSAVHEDDEVPLFTGNGLVVEAVGTPRIRPDEERESGSGRIRVDIPKVSVPDLRVYQRYIPERWATLVEGGDGSLEGRAQYSDTDLSAELTLTSDDADISIRGYRFRSNLDVGIRLSGEAGARPGIDISGTHLRLDDSRLATGADSAKGSEPWSASLVIEQGRLGLPAPGEDTAAEAGFTELARSFKDRGVKQLLSSANARLDAVLDVSDLAWINVFFKGSLNLTIGGAGKIDADLRLASGDLAEGTRLAVTPRGLNVRVLDYLAQGAGAVTVSVERGGRTPDLRLDAELKDATLRRVGEDQAMIDQVAIGFSARASGVSTAAEAGQVTSLALKIPSARVSDMRVYNHYLPEGSPLEILAGQAQLEADILLAPESASGFVNLVTDSLRTRLDEQEVSGRLTMNIRLQDGVPRDMEFDIAGSRLELDGFRVAGEQQSFDQSDWKARFDLIEARVKWRKPIRLDLKAGIEMSDSRPIMAMFANQRGKHGFLEKIMTVQDIDGRAEMHIADERVLIPYAMAGGDKIDVGVKALVTKDEREGIFLARFRALEGILKMRNGERNVDLIGARKRFDAYAPGETPLNLGSSAPPSDSEQSPPENAAAEAPAEALETPLGAFGDSD